MIVNSLPVNAAMQQTYVLDNPPGAGTRFVQGLMSGLETTTPGLLISGDSAQEASLGVPMTKDEWQASEWHRDGLEYTPGMTREWAEILAHRKDKQLARDYAASQQGWGGWAAGLAAEFIGSIPDPLNFIPIVGEASKAVMVAKLGRVAGTAVAMGTDAALGAATLQPFLAGEMQQHQDPYDWKMAVENIAIAFGIGATLGAGVGWFSRVPTAEKGAATSKAAADLMAERPVDVGPVVERPPGPDLGEVQRMQAQIAEIDKQMAQAAPEGKVALGEAKTALEGELARLTEPQPDMAVPPRADAPLPPTEPTTPKNAYQAPAADEIDFSHAERRYAEMESQGLLDPEAVEAVKLADTGKEQTSALAKAYELAGTCLMRSK